jgi:hypothetical protein
MLRSTRLQDVSIRQSFGERIRLQFLEIIIPKEPVMGTTPQNVYVTLTALLATATLVACGGGSSNSTSAPAAQVAEAGQPVVNKILVDDVEVSKATYKVYSVKDDIGTLSDTPLASEADEKRLPHVLLLESQTGSSAPLRAAFVDRGEYALSAAIPLSDLKSCYKDLFATVKTFHPSWGRDAIAARLNDLDMTVDEVCGQVQTSGLSMKDYIILMDKVSDYWPNQKNIDGEVVMFFKNIGVKPSTFQQALTDNGYTWDMFLKRVSGREKGISEFYSLYEQSSLTLTPFLKYYMETATQPKLLAAAKNQLKLMAAWLGKDVRPQVTALVEPKKVLAAAGDSWKTFNDNAQKTFDVFSQYFNMAKVIWSVVENSAGSAEVKNNLAQNYILSKNDTNAMNYYGSTLSNSKKVSFVGDTYAFKMWENYRVDAYLSCRYGAKNDSQPGQWIPDISMKIPRAEAGWSVIGGYEVNANAVAGSIYNNGTATAPIPGMDVTMQVSAKNFTTVRNEYTFSCTGDKGASLLVQP